MQISWLLLIALAGQASASHGPAPEALDDRASAAAATMAYRAAWLTNEPERVMATLTQDAVLFPSGLPPIAGAQAIRRFWFPSTSSTRVIDMELSIDSVSVDGDTAVTSGMGSLTFEVSNAGVTGQPRTQRSWHVNILRRQTDGSWRIWRRMWGDLH